MYFKTSVDYSYTPYVIPNGEQVDLPYVITLAPQDDKVKFEWVDLKNPSNTECSAFLSYNGFEYEEVKISSNLAVMNVTPEKDCFLYIQTKDGRKSIPRPFRSGHYPGTVINYINPEDKQYIFSGRFLGSPFILKTTKGTLFVSLDYFDGAQGQNFAQIYRSDDNGKTWQYVTDLFPAFWASLFEHNDKLYAVTLSHEYGDLTVLESLDEGKTWHGIVLSRGSGHFRHPGWHKNTAPVVKHNGRIWIGIEFGTWTTTQFSMSVLSIDENADFMNIENWTIAEHYILDKDLPDAENTWGGIEGNVVVTPDGELVNILRHGKKKALVLSIDKDNPKAKLKFKEFIDFPMAYTKFDIKQDGDTYYAMGNLSPNRNILDLYTSKDLKTWTKKKTLLDMSSYPAKYVGIQYPTFFIEGNKLKTVLRVAYNGADTFHNSNCISYFEFDKD